MQLAGSIHREFEPSWTVDTFITEDSNPNQTYFVSFGMEAHRLPATCPLS
jgi:hypothetical protein